MWRKVRIAVLLLILLFVALNTYFDRVYSTEWNDTLRVAAFPINADGSAVTERYIRALPRTPFEPIEAFFAEEAKHYELAIAQPVRITLGQSLSELPPALPEDAGTLGVMWWSLKMRHWAWQVDGPPGSEIKLFLLYHDPQRSQVLPHSVGMQKGLFGVVHVFADRTMEGSNDVVISHELLHTLGATDKYDLANGLPQLPDGYAEPNRKPLFPQSFAELMGGRIPRTASEADIPESLREVIVGKRTASEIGWSKQR
jgi:hypothetical protein